MPAVNTYELISQAARRAPGAEAIIFLPTGEINAEATRLTFEELAARIAKAARAFARLGVGPNDAVSLLLPNVLDVQAAFWGAEATGIVNPVNFLLDVDHAAEIVKATGAKALVALGPHPEIGIWQKAEAVKARAPGLEFLISVGADAPGALSFERLLAAEDGAGFECDKAPTDVAAYFHTGGTTGAPKLVQHTHENQMRAALATAECYEFREGDVVWSGLPMFHVAGPMVLSLAPLAAGATIVMPTPAGNRDPLIIQNYWKLVEKYGVSLVGGVPTTLADILNAAGPPTLAEAPRRACMTGGAQLTIGLERRFVDATGVPIHQLYGMTETAGVIAAAPRGERSRPGFIGKAVAGVEIRATRLRRDGEPGEACAPGEPGVLCVRGANVSAGYKKGSTLVSLTDAEGWLNTGDLGVIDEEGWVRLTGRAKDVIIRSGHNIDPASIEEVAEKHPAVSQAVAVGRPDLRTGEAPVVFAMLKEGVSLSPAALKEFIIRNISEAPAKPADVCIVSAIPLTAIGKVFRPALRREAVRALVQQKCDETFGAEAAPNVEIDESCAHAIRVVIRCENAVASGEAAARLDDWLSQHAFEFEYIPSGKLTE